MADGRAGEFDHPYKLLVEKLGDLTITNQGGLFAQMCLATGEDTAQSLFEIAKKQYDTTGQKFPYDSKESVGHNNPGQDMTNIDIEDLDPRL